MQTKSDALRVQLLGLLDKPVQAEELALVLLFNTAPIVSDTDHEHVVAADAVSQVRMDLPVRLGDQAIFDVAGLNIDATFQGREFDRVGKEVEQYLLDAAFVAMDKMIVLEMDVIGLDI